jgi:hypothetical protein
MISASSFVVAASATRSRAGSDASLSGVDEFTSSSLNGVNNLDAIAITDRGRVPSRSRYDGVVYRDGHAARHDVELL